MKRVLLIRHAESTNNALQANLVAASNRNEQAIRKEAEVQRASDADLSPLGVEQARLLGEEIGRRDPPHPLLVSSPMRRALRTASEIGSALSTPRERFLCKGDLFEVGGAYFQAQPVPTTTRREIEEQYPVTCRDVDDDGWFSNRTSVETSEEARRRIQQIIGWSDLLLREPDAHFETLIIVAHGDLMSRWLRRWLGIPIGAGLVIMHHNTGITSLSFDPGRGLLLHGMNDASHLPAAMRSGDAESWWDFSLPDLRLSRFEGLSSIPPALLAEINTLRAQHLWSVESQTADARQADDRGVHFIAEAVGSLAGCVIFDPLTNRLRQMVVDPRYRNSRIGRQLVSCVEAEARRHGRKEIAVHAWQQSCAFYERAGFRPAGNIRTEAPIPWQPMLRSL